MKHGPFDLTVVFRLGPVPVTLDVVVTWGVMLVLAALGFFATRGLAERPGRRQAAAEAAIGAMASQIREISGADPAPFLPLLGTLFLFLAAANLSANLPGVKAPTAHLETPAALAAVVFLSVHWYGARRRGVWAYLKTFARPNVLLLPFNLVAQVTRTFSLMVRLFGNVMSGELLLGILLSLAGLLVPVPFMALHAVICVIQAYIFTVLAAVFVGAAVGTAEGA